MKAALIKLNR